MSAATTDILTTEEMLALPGNGVDRELIRGELREKPMTMRNRTHSRVEALIAKVLGFWSDSRSKPRGEVVSGEAGFRLRRNPDTSVGIDVAYVSPEIAARDPEKPFFEGPPVLAVEVLSPSDSQQDIDEKIELYLQNGVKIVWVVNPRLKTVLVLRPDARPAVFAEGQTLDAEPHLPGFRTEVDKFFGP